MFLCGGKLQCNRVDALRESTLLPEKIEHLSVPAAQARMLCISKPLFA